MFGQPPAIRTVELMDWFQLMYCEPLSIYTVTKLEPKSHIYWSSFGNVGIILHIYSNLDWAVANLIFFGCMQCEIARK